jgi:hypothetical protein
MTSPDSADNERPPWALPLEWWRSRQLLDLTHRWAVAGGVPPAFVLGHLLAAVALGPPLNALLPGIIGAPASLNFGAVLVVITGGGKSASHSPSGPRREPSIGGRGKLRGRGRRSWPQSGCAIWVGAHLDTELNGSGESTTPAHLVGMMAADNQLVNHLSIDTSIFSAARQSPTRGWPSRVTTASACTGWSTPTSWSTATRTSCDLGCCLSAGAALEQHNHERAQHDPHVVEQRPVVDVVQVEPLVLLERRVVAS